MRQARSVRALHSYTFASDLLPRLRTKGEDEIWVACCFSCKNPSSVIWSVYQSPDNCRQPRAWMSQSALSVACQFEAELTLYLADDSSVVRLLHSHSSCETRNGLPKRRERSLRSFATQFGDGWAIARGARASGARGACSDSNRTCGVWKRLFRVLRFLQ